MKRAVAVILAAITLLLCGCSNKVEEAQRLLDNGDYKGAIELAEELLESGEDASVANEIKIDAAYGMLESGDYEEALDMADSFSGTGDSTMISVSDDIKIKAVYGLQKDAYNNKQFDKATQYYMQIQDYGLSSNDRDLQVYNPNGFGDTGDKPDEYYLSFKLDAVVQAEQYLCFMKDSYSQELWGSVESYYNSICRLSQRDSLSYGEDDDLNARMSEIVSESENIFNKSRQYILYTHVVNCIEDNDLPGATEAAEALHSDYLGSEEDIAAQELVAKVIEEREAKREEEEALVEERRKAREQELKNTIRVKRVWTSNPDSAGGVELYINFTNMSDKTIKYVRFGVQLYNAVDDVVECKYNDALFGVYYCRDTGPYEKGEGLSGTSWYWGDFYNWDIDHAELVSVEIEYMDGTEIEIDGDDIELVQY